MKYIKSDLCQLGWLSCMGCCTNELKTKIEAAKIIKKNTLDFENHKKTGKKEIEFMKRSDKPHENGMCKNIIYDQKINRIYCPLHPKEHRPKNGKDARVEHEHCDIMHVCKTAYMYDLWDDKRKTEFLRFLKIKKRKHGLDWFDYSKKMANDSLVEEFEGLKWD